MFMQSFIIVSKDYVSLEEIRSSFRIRKLRHKTSGSICTDNQAVGLVASSSKGCGNSEKKN